jgi:hypothetical protein
VLGRTTGNSDTQDWPWPGLGGSHHLLPYSILCASPQWATSKWLFCPGTPKWESRNCNNWDFRITSCENLRSWWSLKQSCSPRWELSNGLSHIPCTHGNRVNSQLLMVRSQIVNLTLDHSFGHNLCYRCPNGQCEPILGIYALTAFRWYKECLKARSFDPCNRVLKIWEFTWECEGSCPHTLCTPRGMWSDSQVFLLAHHLPTPCLGREPKVRVATLLRYPNIRPW